MLPKSIAVAVALTLSALATDTARAQSADVANGSVFGDWAVICSAQTVSQTVCGLVQRITAAPERRFIAELGLNRIEQGDEVDLLLVMQTPTGVLLRLRPAIQIGTDGETLPLDWHNCSNEVCSATRLLTDAEIASLRTGESLTIGYQFVSDTDPINVPGSLAGINDALDALRIP